MFRRISLKLEDFKGVKKSNPLKELADPDNTAMAVFECLSNDDLNGAVEMFQLHLEALRIKKSHSLCDKEKE